MTRLYRPDLRVNRQAHYRIYFCRNGFRPIDRESRPDPVKLAAIRDALDRAGLKPITAVDLEVSTKPWEAVFEGISKVVAGPRDPEALAIEGDMIDEPTDTFLCENLDDPDEIDGVYEEIVDVEIDSGKRLSTRATSSMRRASQQTARFSARTLRCRQC